MSVPVTGSEQKNPPKYLAESKNSKAPDLVSLVENVRHLSSTQPSHLGRGIVEKIDTDLAFYRSMNLIPFPVKKRRTQQTDPTVFFKHIGCHEAPYSCEPQHLQGFYQLVSSYHFSDALALRNFLDFDMFTNLKKMHESCPSPALKGAVEDKINQWKKLRAEASYAIWAEKNYKKYIDGVDLFRQQLYELLQKKAPNGTVEYLFPKILKKVDQNCNFLMQFSGLNYNAYLLNISLRHCSGTHPILPMDISQIPEVLKHFQNLAELTLESMVIGHKSKLIPIWNFPLLQEVLAKVRTLAKAHPEALREEAQELLVRCKEMALDATETFFSHIDVRAFFDPDKSEDELVSLLSQQLSSIKDGSIQKKIIGMIEFVNLLTEFYYLIEDSILNHLDSEYVFEVIYSNRIATVLMSLVEESDLVNRQKSEVAGLEKLSGEFFATLSRLEFSAKAIALLHCKKRKTQLLLNLYDKHLYRLLKSATEEAIESLQVYCKKQAADLQGRSLFQETQWLAKALILVHDLGMRLKDPAVSEGIEFHPDYIQLIHQYDPSVWLQADAEESELAVETQSYALVEEPEPPKSTPSEPAEIKTERAAPPDESVPQAPARPAPPARRPAPLASKRTPDKPDRGGLREAIIGTQGDLRKMSRILRRMLGWSIKHQGKRHPTILDGNRNPVAPVPTTGHAAIGTVISVAESVCVAAEAQGLM